MTRRSRPPLSSTRILDVVAVVLALPLVTPLLILLAIAVKATSRGPVVYRSVRIGFSGQPFCMYKLRTMTHEYSVTGPPLTCRDDMRVTAVGRRLRRWKLDELPQLFNVLRGDMSLVGPRPEVPQYVDPTSRLQQLAFTVRPGMTSPASLVFRHEEDLLRAADLDTDYRTVILPAKLAVDSMLATDRSLRTHLRLIAVTLLQLVFNRGAKVLLPDPLLRPAADPLDPGRAHVR